MPYFIVDTIDDGPDANYVARIRPVVSLFSDTWVCTADAPGIGRMLIRAPHVPEFDTDVRIRPLRRAMLANIAPDDGEVDDWEAPDLARKVARRFLVRQWLGADDFAVTAGALSLTLGDIPAARRQRIRNRLLARNIDISGLTLTTSIADALRFILPQFPVRLDPRGLQSPGGTFTDDFSGEASEVDLQNHTPSGGTAWTRVDASANDALVDDLDPGRVLSNNTTGGLYVCDDQGSANQYVEYENDATTDNSSFVCNRATDGSNFIGMRIQGSDLRIYKNVAASLTQLASTASSANRADDIFRLESSGDAHEAFVNGVTETGPVNDSFNNTETRQGVVPRQTRAIWIGVHFEAGTLGGGGGVSTAVGSVSAAATTTAIGRSFAHVVGNSAGVASVAGVGANANAGERETVGTSTGQASVVGVGQSEVFTVGNSAGSVSVVGVGEAVLPPGQSVGVSSGIATVLGVASSIAEAVGTSSGSSDASGVNPQVVVTQRLVVGAGGELSWEDHVKTIHEMRMLEGQVRRQRKELQKVVKQIKSVEKKFKAEKTEGILANLHRLEQKKDELENKIEALEVDLEPLTMAIEKFEMREIEEDDQEFMSLM